MKSAVPASSRFKMSGVAGVTLVKAIYSFKGSHNDELNFKKGAVITLTQKGHNLNATFGRCLFKFFVLHIGMYLVK